VAAAKKANSAQPDTHDYSEAETRTAFIDLLLKEAGWTLDPAKNFEVEVTGMPNAENKGFVDYVLWGDDGKPLALVEAKRTTREPDGGPAAGQAVRRLPGGEYGQRP
jgi:type I restriction enzyme R subunit